MARARKPAPLVSDIRQAEVHRTTVKTDTGEVITDEVTLRDVQVTGTETFVQVYESWFKIAPKLDGNCRLVAEYLAHISEVPRTMSSDDEDSEGALCEVMVNDLVKKRIGLRLDIAVRSIDNVMARLCKEGVILRLARTQYAICPKFFWNSTHGKRGAAVKRWMKVTDKPKEPTKTPSEFEYPDVAA